MKKISVIVPCYNVEESIDICVKSIVSQTISQNDYEVILINDGSTDNTFKHLEKWESEYSELIMVINLEQNCGMSYARNIAIDVANGEYIAFVDSDDWIECNYLERLLELTDNGKHDVTMCGYDRPDTYCIEKTNAERGTEQIYNLDDISERKRFISEHLSQTAVWRALYRREFILNEDIRFPDGVYYEDGYFTYMAYFTAMSIAVCSDCLYHYYKNRNGLVQSGCEGKQRERLVVLQMFMDKAVEKGWFESYHDELELIYIRKYYIEMLDVMVRKFENIDYAVFCELKSSVKKYFPDYMNNIYIKQNNDPVDDLFLICIEQNFDEVQINAFKKMYLEKVYGVDKVLYPCTKEIREVSYPQLEEFMWGLEQVLLDMGNIDFDEYIQLFKCVPVMQDVYERIELLDEQDSFQRSEIYRYIVDRECALEYIMDKLERGGCEARKHMLYRNILESI